jgi:hypothetical protein
MDLWLAFRRLAQSLTMVLADRLDADDPTLESAVWAELGHRRTLAEPAHFSWSLRDAPG